MYDVVVPPPGGAPVSKSALQDWEEDTKRCCCLRAVVRVRELAWRERTTSIPLNPYALPLFFYPPTYFFSAQRTALVTRDSDTPQSSFVSFLHQARVYVRFLY